MALVLLAAWLLHLALGWVMTETETLAEGASLRAGMLMLLLGALALRDASTQRMRIACWLAAMAVFGWIVSVALSRQPAGFLAAFFPAIGP